MKQVIEPSPVLDPQQAAGQAAGADRALRISELNYRRLFETAQDGILILDADTGRVNDVNPFLIQLLGFSHEEMVGRTVGELSPFKDIVSNRAMLTRLQRDGFVRYHDLPLETKNGRTVAVEFVSNVYQVGESKVIQCNIREITARKQAEVALHAAQQFLAEVVEALPVRVFWKDRNSVYLGCNTSFARDAGFAGPNDIIGKVDSQMAWGKQAEAFRGDDRQVIASGQSKLLFEEMLTNPFGTMSTILTTKIPLREAKGEIIGVLGSYIDITERALAKKQLRLSEEQFRAMFEMASVGMAQADPGTGQFLRVNEKMCAITGYPAPELLQLHVSQLTHPDDRQKDWAAFQRVAQGKAPDYQMEKRYRRKNGKVIWVNVNMTLVRNPAGQPFRTMATIEDITDRKMVQEAHDRLAMAVEAAAETIVITDTAGAIVYANPAFEKSTGYLLAEVLGQNPRVLKSGKQDDEFYMQMWATLARGEVWSGHFINKRKDGTFYEEEATISPVRDAAGTIINFVAVKRDVTREVQLEAQFRQAQKMEAIGQLAGGVAHDFNNILGVIQMQADLLRLFGGLSGEQSESIEEIATSVQRAAALTRQLLIFSRREVFHPGELDLNETMAATSKMLKRMLGETIGMQLKLAAQPMLLHADAGMLDQVLMNLCVNARDAMPGGGQLVIETSGLEFDELALRQSAQARPGAFVCLSVSDNGSGIPPEILTRIFEPFFTTKPVGKGTGLGLATVFGIVEQHQGWINVHSVIHQGTTFRIYLPRRKGNGLIKSTPPPLPAMRRGHETILLVEDEPALRVAVRKALDQMGYRILEAPTGMKALEVWQENRDEISLLLTDLVMPDGMTGKDLAQRLRKENPQLKVIYMSGYGAEILGKDFSLTQNVNFLSKPFQARKLVEAVRECLDAAAAG